MKNFIFFYSDSSRAPCSPRSPSYFTSIAVNKQPIKEAGVLLFCSLQGPSVLECMATGSWDRAPPTCHLVFCGEPPAIKDAVITGSNFTVGNTVTYACKEG